MNNIILFVLFISLIIYIINKVFLNEVEGFENKKINLEKIYIKLRDTYGDNFIKELFPRTFLIDEFNHEPEKLYFVIKNNNKLLVDQITKIKKAYKNGYRLIQDVNYHYYQIGKYTPLLKFNVIKVNNKWYVSLDGKIEYSQYEYYDYFNNYDQPQITLREEKLYPHTLLKFREYLDKLNRPFTHYEANRWRNIPNDKFISDIVFDKIYEKLVQIVKILDSNRSYTINVNISEDLKPILESIEIVNNFDYKNNLLIPLCSIRQ